MSAAAEPGPHDASDVTFVVMNWNGREFLEVVLPSIHRQTAAGFTVNVVDDASSDDSRAYVEREWPGVNFIAHQDNVGLTRNMTRAVQSAQTEYVALLNNDLELEPDWLWQLRSTLQAHPDAAAAEGKMLDYYHRERIDGAGDDLGWTLAPGRRGNGQVDAGQFERPEEIFSVSCGAALFRRAALEDVGPFDGNLFAYYEDVDWGLRARLLGYSARYQPAAVCFHMGSSTMNRKPGRWSHLFPRNQIYVMLKNVPASLLRRHWWRILAWELQWLLLDVRTGFGAKHAKGWWQALGMVPHALRERRAVQAAVRISDDQLERAMTPRLQWRREPGSWKWRRVA